MMAYSWPGNVRELRTAIEHGVVMSNSSRIMLKHLPHYLGTPGGFVFQPRPAAPPQVNVPSAKSSDGLSTKAAELLGISRRTLQRKLKEMGLVRRRRGRE